MPTTLRFLFSLLLGLLGFQAVAYTYDVVGFVSLAEQCTYVSTSHNQAAPTESTVSVPLCLDRDRADVGFQADFAPTANFIAAETGAAQPLALGLKDAGLEQFAQARGATLATGENWQATVLEKLADPNTTVHFNLDEVDVWQGVQRAASGRGGPTDWELLQIQQNPQSWDTLQFWKSGQPAPNPFK